MDTIQSAFEFMANVSPAGPYDPGEHRVPLHIQAPVKGGDVRVRSIWMRIKDGTGPMIMDTKKTDLKIGLVELRG